MAYIPFDLKISKLTGTNWERKDRKKLAHQLMSQQGKYRYSVENRIFILFDQATSSSCGFISKNYNIIVDNIIQIARDPYTDLYNIVADNRNVFCWVKLINRTDYRGGDEGYYEHSLGEGLREPNKADISYRILDDVATQTKNIIVNRNFKEHGIDGWIIVPDTFPETKPNKAPTGITLDKFLKPQPL